MNLSSVWARIRSELKRKDVADEEELDKVEHKVESKYEESKEAVITKVEKSEHIDDNKLREKYMTAQGAWWALKYMDVKKVAKQRLKRKYTSIKKDVSEKIKERTYSKQQKQVKPEKGPEDFDFVSETDEESSEYDYKYNKTVKRGGISLYKDEREEMNAEYGDDFEVKVEYEGGEETFEKSVTKSNKITIPAEVRNSLGLEDDDEITVELSKL